MDNQKVFAMSFSRVYPLLTAKAERKGRTAAEVDAVICWLTGYSAEELRAQLEKQVSFEEFFAQALAMNPNCTLITGTICGIRVEQIEDPLMQNIRRLDKLVDELAKGRPMEKILRGSTEPSGWVCPVCGRTFSRRDQQHYCGSKPTTIDEYILAQDEGIRADLQTIRGILSAALPEAEERISWSMPTYWKGHNIIHFAASKKHIGLYPGPEAVAFFADELKPYKTDKGTIRIPYGKIDADLITRLARWCIETGNHA